MGYPTFQQQTANIDVSAVKTMHPYFQPCVQDTRHYKKDTLVVDDKNR